MTNRKLSVGGLQLQCADLAHWLADRVWEVSRGEDKVSDKEVNWWLDEVHDELRISIDERLEILRDENRRDDSTW